MTKTMICRVFINPYHFKVTYVFTSLDFQSTCISFPIRYELCCNFERFLNRLFNFDSEKHIAFPHEQYCKSCSAPDRMVSAVQICK